MGRHRFTVNLNPDELERIVDPVSAARTRDGRWELERDALVGDARAQVDDRGVLLDAACPGGG